MDEACARLQARVQARAQAEKADYERKRAQRQQREASAKGPQPKPFSGTPAPEEQINLTDADARLMRKSKREGYTPSYNAQAVVDAEGSQLIVGQRVSPCASDAGEMEPDLQSIVSVHREDAPAERRYDYRPLQKRPPPQKLRDPVLVAMAEKLKTVESKAIYRKRACTVEPVFGIVKTVMGFRQFLLRGLEKVGGEWNWVCLACHLKRLHVLQMAAVSSSIKKPASTSPMYLR